MTADRAIWGFAKHGYATRLAPLTNGHRHLRDHRIMTLVAYTVGLRQPTPPPPQRAYTAICL